MNKNKFQLIPAIDIIDGKCVRLEQGNYSLKKIYSENPLEMALKFQDIGAQRLHLVDLDGAKKGEVVNINVLEKIASKTNLQIDFGGGIKTEKSLEKVFNSGAKLATIGSLAVKNKPLFETWIEKYGSNKFFLGADVKDNFIAINGWLETTQIDVFEFIQDYLNLGLSNIFCTDISKDGLLEGPATELYQKIIEKCVNIKLVASGGVSSMSDIKKLNEINCSGAIVGKAIYEGRISWKELEEFYKQ